MQMVVKTIFEIYIIPGDSRIDLDIELENESALVPESVGCPLIPGELSLASV